MDQVSGKAINDEAALLDAIFFSAPVSYQELEKAVHGHGNVRKQSTPIHDRCSLFDSYTDTDPDADGHYDELNYWFLQGTGYCMILC